jgi:hypothetical protein
MEEMKRRAKESHVYQKHQSVGLALAEILRDPKHKALYIRLAKTMNESVLMELAKNVAGRKNIKNAGAYFMRLLYKDLSRLENNKSIDKPKNKIEKTNE